MKKTTTYRSKPKVFVSDYEKEQIIEFFLKNKNNTMKELSEKFGFSAYVISKVIDEYYKKI